MKKRCPIHQHEDIVLKRGSIRVRCKTCGDIFPCFNNCRHLDCCVASDRPLPDGFTFSDNTREAIKAELAMIYPQIYKAD